MKFGIRGAAALEAAYQEKKPYTEWTDKHGRKHKASLKNWKVDFNGKSFNIRRFEPGSITKFTKLILHLRYRIFKVCLCMVLSLFQPLCR